MKKVVLFRMINIMRSIKYKVNREFLRIYYAFFSSYPKWSFGKLGRCSVIGKNSDLVPQNMYIDDFCFIQNRVNFISNKGKLFVGKYSVISSGCIIVPGSHILTVGVPFYLATTDHINDEEGSIIIEEDCWIGAGCILLPKCHIGRGAVIGAGCVVKKNIPPYAVVVGVPARIIGSKFSLEEILLHEIELYNKEERLTREELEVLFKTYYEGKISIGVNNLTDEEKENLEYIKNKVGIANVGK